MQENDIVLALYTAVSKDSRNIVEELSLLYQLRYTVKFDASEHYLLGQSILSWLITKKPFKQFSLYAFARRYGWSENEISNRGAAFSSQATSFTDEKRKLNDVLDGFIASFKLCALNETVLGALEFVCLASSTKHVVREQTFKHFFEMLKCNLLSRNESTSEQGCPSSFKLVKDLMLLGVTDVWSAVRKMCANKLYAVADMFDADQLAELFCDLVSMCSSQEQPWRAKEGALLALNSIIKRFQWSDDSTTLQHPLKSRPTSRALRNPFPSSGGRGNLDAVDDAGGLEVPMSTLCVSVPVSPVPSPCPSPPHERRPSSPSPASVTVPMRPSISNAKSLSFDVRHPSSSSASTPIVVTTEATGIEKRVLRFGSQQQTYERLPDYICTLLPPMLHHMLAHPQLTVRDAAAKTLSAYLSRCPPRETLQCFSEVLARLAPPSSASLPLLLPRTFSGGHQSKTPTSPPHVATPPPLLDPDSNHRLSPGPGSPSGSIARTHSTGPFFPSSRSAACLHDAYEAEGLLSAVVMLMRRIPPRYLMETWGQYSAILLPYLSHPASTVRQATSSVFDTLLTLVAKESLPDAIFARVLLQELSAGWDVDAPLNSPMKSCASPSALGRQPDTEGKASARGGGGLESFVRQWCAGTSGSMGAAQPSWEWREGRLLAYELILTRLCRLSCPSQPRRSSLQSSLHALFPLPASPLTSVRGRLPHVASLPAHQRVPFGPSQAPPPSAPMLADPPTSIRRHVNPNPNPNPPHPPPPLHSNSTLPISGSSREHSEVAAPSPPAVVSMSTPAVAAAALYDAPPRLKPPCTSSIMDSSSPPAASAPGSYAYHLPSPIDRASSPPVFPPASAIEGIRLASSPLHSSGPASSPSLSSPELVTSTVTLPGHASSGGDVNQFAEVSLLELLLLNDEGGASAQDTKCSIPSTSRNLVVMQLQTMEAVVDMRWELRRMADQVLPLITYVLCCTHFDLLLCIWQTCLPFGLEAMHSLGDLEGPCDWRLLRCYAACMTLRHVLSSIRSACSSSSSSSRPSTATPAPSSSSSTSVTSFAATLIARVKTALPPLLPLIVGVVEKSVCKDIRAIGVEVLVLVHSAFPDLVFQPHLRLSHQRCVCDCLQSISNAVMASASHSHSTRTYPHPLDLRSRSNSDNEYEARGLQKRVEVLERSLLTNIHPFLPAFVAPLFETNGTRGPMAMPKSGMVGDSSRAFAFAFAFAEVLVQYMGRYDEVAIQLSVLDALSALLPQQPSASSVSTSTSDPAPNPLQSFSDPHVHTSNASPAAAASPFPWDSVASCMISVLERKGVEVIVIRRVLDVLLSVCATVQDATYIRRIYAAIAPRIRSHDEKRRTDNLYHILSNDIPPQDGEGTGDEAHESEGERSKSRGSFSSSAVRQGAEGFYATILSETEMKLNCNSEGEGEGASDSDDWDSDDDEGDEELVREVHNFTVQLDHCLPGLRVAALAQNGPSTWPSHHTQWLLSKVTPS